MKHATTEDFEKVKEIFYQYRDIFPHIRTDFIKREIAANRCIFENGVIITYKIYKRPQKIGTVLALKDHCLLQQIVKDKNNEKANAAKTLQCFFDYINTLVWLSVRRDNIVAKSFYTKMGMSLVGEHNWSKGSLPGDVYLYKNEGSLVWL